jgi:hypothetical protein
VRLSTFQRDALERIIWTFIQALAGVYATEVTGLDPLWAVPIAAALASIKTVAARAIGDRDSAATLPAYVDEALLELALKVAQATVKKTK